MGQIAAKNAAVTLPTGYVFDALTFDITETQAIAATTPMGAGTYQRNLGSGCPNMEIQVTGYAKTGGGSLGLGTMAGTSGGYTGASATFTVDTSTTVVGSVVASRLNVGVNRHAAGAPVSATFNSAGDMVTTWT